LRYDARSGAFVDVFASGTGQPGAANGPNGLAFGPDGKLYVTTEGSVAGTFPGLPSEVLRFDIGTRVSEVFVAQPAPAPSSPGYVSLLGLVFGPDYHAHVSGHQNACDLFVSDLANDIRRYDVHGVQKAQLSTNYTGTTPSSNAIGALTLGEDRTLFTVGFDQRPEAQEIGVILRYDAVTNAPRPRAPNPGALFVAPSAALARPIAVLSSSQLNR
jgi:hypothetical protein